jgi:hypothetical protein
MKKLIAIAVVFVLVAGAAFADISVSGAAGGKAILGAGSSSTSGGTTTTNSNTVGGGVATVVLAAEAQNEDGTFGGKVDFETSFAKPASIDARGHAWWKPIPQVKVQIGSAGGEFGFNNILGWGFYEGDNDYLAWPLESYSHPSVFGGPSEGHGLFLSVSPIGGLDVNIYIPFGRFGSDPWETYAKTNLQIKYGIDNIGTFALSYEGGTYGYNDADATSRFDSDGNIKYGDGAKMYAGFELTALEGLNAFLGAGFTFPVKNEKLMPVGANEYTITKTASAPMWIGLGASYAAGAFGIKARFELGFGGNLKTEYAGKNGYDVTSISDADANKETKDDTVFRFNLFPYYNVNDNLKVALATGMSISAPDKDPADNTKVSYYIQPYLSFSSGGGTFWAGFELQGSSSKTGGTEASGASWAIPIGLKFGL